MIDLHKFEISFYGLLSTPWIKVIFPSNELYCRIRTFIMRKIFLLPVALTGLLSAAYTFKSVAPAAQSTTKGLPEGFVYVKDVIPDIVLDMRYLTANNFLGSPVEGYKANKCILSKEAAMALKKVQEDLKAFGLGLKIFDAYRPQQAVNHFVKWAEDVEDVTNKPIYYPNIPKDQLFAKGFIAARSGHSRGSTVDLTIISLKEDENQQELSMGTRFDFFGPPSWPDYPDISFTARAHRKLLQLVMEKHGFKHLPEEWWHFTLVDEPYPDTYFDFPVE